MKALTENPTRRYKMLEGLVPVSSPIPKIVGSLVGCVVGASVGQDVGASVGQDVGKNVGILEG